MLECVVNVSEGRDRAVISSIAQAGGACVLDVHSDPDHHRTVLTMAGDDLEEAVRAVASRTVACVDLRAHTGVHPRMGALDVVPFVALPPAGARPPGPGHDGAPPLDLASAVAARGRFAAWAAGALDLPCFLYGPERTLPEVRRHAFTSLAPDAGPPRPHPSAGACAVGARGVLVAYNLWLAGADLAGARAIAGAVRGPAVRALGLAVAGGTQVSCNLIEPLVYGPAEVFDAVAALAREAGASIARAELVGLVPAAVLGAVPPSRHHQLDLGPERTIEARLAGWRAR